MPKKYKIYLSVLLIVLLGIATVYFWPKHVVRYAVFAGYNADKTIPAYVLTYLKELNKVTDGVVYIADSELLPQEQEKLKNLVIYTKHHHHQEYDFGSYKRGYNWLKKNGYLKKADELIFANDSTYAPLTSFQPMFTEMSKRPDLDFWGDLQNTRFNPHLQSYFLVFRKPVIQSKSFASFLQNVRHQEHSSLYITEYEVKLTPHLASLGYKWDSYLPYAQLQDLSYSDKNAYPLTLIQKYNHQFIKRSLFKKRLYSYENLDTLLDYIKVISPTLYKDIIEDTPHEKP